VGGQYVKEASELEKNLFFLHSKQALVGCPLHGRITEPTSTALGTGAADSSVRVSQGKAQ